MPSAAKPWLTQKPIHMATRIATRFLTIGQASSSSVEASTVVSISVSTSATSTAPPRTRRGVGMRPRSMRTVPAGPPTRPPATMPPIATAIATEDAPTTPASSKSGAKARPVAGPPVKRDRAGEHAEQRMQPEADRHQDADDVLHDGEDRGQQEEAQHLGPADLEERQARAEADGREEGDHQRALQRRVELHEVHALAPRDEHRDGDQQAPEHGRRQVVAGEDRHQPPQALAEQQGDAREGEGLDEV